MCDGFYTVYFVMFVYIEMIDSIQYQCECRHSIIWPTQYSLADTV